MADMEIVSPSADRIGAALRALRQTHAPETEDNTALGMKCLRAVIAQLGADGVKQEDLQPLIDLEAQLLQSKGKAPEPAQAKALRERRQGTSPSPILLARAAAVIDLLVKSGNDESEAAQAVMRRLVAAGVPPPIQGGDSRGWRRLLEWRNAILQGVGPAEAKQEYRMFTQELEAIPPAERVKRVLDERLWDRRKAPR
jgi:hypothetical protein